MSDGGKGQKLSTFPGLAVAKARMYAPRAIVTGEPRGHRASVFTAARPTTAPVSILTMEWRVEQSRIRWRARRPDRDPHAGPRNSRVLAQHRADGNRAEVALHCLAAHLQLLAMTACRRINVVPAKTGTISERGANTQRTATTAPSRTACASPRTPSALPWRLQSSRAARFGFRYRRCSRRTTSRRSRAWRICRAGSRSATCR
jgi:hypothetical protein